MHVVAISDLHGHLPSVAEMPEGDVLLIAGDVCPLWSHDQAIQAMWLKSDFTDWLNALPYDQVVGVGGNHDFVLEDSRIGEELPWIYLDDTSTDIGGLKVYGSPMANRFGQWAFMADEKDLDEHYWSGIPADVDILITHGPAYGLGDRVNNDWSGKSHVGSPGLRKRLGANYPDLKLYVFGHIHEGRGKYAINKAIAANVSHCDERYSIFRGPMAFDL